MLKKLLDLNVVWTYCERIFDVRERLEAAMPSQVYLRVLHIFRRTTIARKTLHFCKTMLSDTIIKLCR